MKSDLNDKTYKSPVRKLARFFEKSRNLWKAKYRQSKTTIKRLQNRVRFLDKRKEHWKSCVKELEAKLAQMEAQTQILKKELEALRKETAEDTATPEGLEDFRLIPRRHHYSIGHVLLFVSLVLSDAASLRCAGRALETVFSMLHLSLFCPSWLTGRLWILRLGYYKLTRPKAHARDWVWIVDHTIQIGAEKCLVILGLRLCALPPSGQCLRHEDVEAIDLVPVKQSNGEVVYQQLEKAVTKTGMPREIIGDHGADLKSGVEKFCRAHPETAAVYDIKHKTAAVLEHELQPDVAWQEFTHLAALTKQQLQQTALAPLMPPNQRTKARYMNVDVLIQWGQTLLTVVDEAQQEEKSKFDPNQVKNKIGWITRFRQPLAEWGELLQIVTSTESFVRQQGLYHGAHLELQDRLQLLAHSERTHRVRTELVAFVAAQEAKAHPNERLLGSSEVIESVLGKMKRLEQDQAKSGFTGLVLSIGAMVSATTQEVVQKSLEIVPTKQVLTWCKKTIGQSIQARRREAFASHGKTEQKPDPLCSTA